MKIVFYENWDELQPLAAHWNQLLSASASDTLFLTWEWCEAWWRNYGAARRLMVLAAWEGDRLLGVAPLYVDIVRRCGISAKCLRIIGDGSNDSDYLDCFAARGREAEVMNAFLAFLEQQKKSWDWLESYATPADSPCLDALSRAAHEKGWHHHAESIACATVTLPKSWDEYLAGLRPRFRTKIRSCVAELEQQIRSAPRQCETDAELAPWLEELFDLHGRRWSTKGQLGVFGDEHKRSFYRDISRSALQRGWLAFHRLDWAGRPLALQYGFRYSNRFYLLQEGYDPAFETLRPGMALRTWLMRHWIEAGLAEYDFLAGISAAKMEWGAQQKTSRRVLLAPHSPKAWIWLEGPQIRRQLKERVRSAVPEALLSARQNFRARRAGRNPGRQAAFNLVAEPPLLQRTVQRTASFAYRNSPLGPLTRRLANRYTFSNGSPSSSFVRLHTRKVPACQIFMYHRVNDDGDPFFYATPLSEFQRQMEYLARNFRVVSLDDIGQGRFPANGHKCCVAITFDDGYRDNFTYAFPVLKKLGIPATIFLATGCVEAGEIPWYDQARLAFKLSMQPRFSLAAIGGPSGLLESVRLKFESMERTLAWLRSLEECSRRRALSELFRELRVPSGLNLRNTMLRWEDVRLMAKQGITFGAHTVTHPVLAGLSKERLQEEISGSKRMVENRLQLPVKHFAYPFGKRDDFSPLAKLMVKEAGFETAATTVFGTNQQEDDRFELKRLGLWERDMGMFALRLDWYRLGGGSSTEDRKEQTRAQ